MEEKKVENIRNMQFAREYLAKTNIASQIVNHPRFESILWKISTLMRRAGVKAFSQEAIALLGSTIIVKADGSVTIFENEERTAGLASTQYYWDTDVLRRVRCQTDVHNLTTTTVSTYSENGLEEEQMLEQNCIDGSKHYSHTTRVPDRIDMIQIERISERNGVRERLEDVLQIRTFCVAYEDITPDADEIDPLDVVHFSFLGVPELYRDLSPKEKKVIDECEGEIFALDDEHKEAQLADCIQTNLFYGRTRRFEEAVAEYLSIEDRLPSEEQTL